jgi:hypothetical protein
LFRRNVDNLNTSILQKRVGRHKQSITVAFTA